MQWLEEFRSAMDREFGERSRVMVLATVGRAGAPHARCVICRKIDDEGRIIISTDARTQKNSQLRGDKRSELVIWLPSLRIQYRITGDARIVAYPEDEPMRKEIWRAMSDQSRALLFWPTPGVAAATDDAFAQAVSADVPPPRTFELIIVQPRVVDRLSMETFPHRRRVWRSDAQWAGVEVNP